MILRKAMYVGVWTYVAIILILAILEVSYPLAVLVGLIAVLPYVYYRGYQLNRKVRALRIPKNNRKRFYENLGLSNPPLIDYKTVLMGIGVLLILIGLMVYFHITDKSLSSALVLIVLMGWVKFSLDDNLKKTRARKS